MKATEMKTTLVGMIKETAGEIEIIEEMIEVIKKQDTMKECNLKLEDFFPYKVTKNGITIEINIKKVDK